jgi:septum site-determining protein MinC
MGKLARPRNGDAANAAMRSCRTAVYAAPVLTPRPPIVEWLSELDATLQSERPFAGDAVVLDLASVRLSARAIVHLIASLEERRIRILGIEGVDPGVADEQLPPILCRHHENQRAPAAPAVARAALPSPASPQTQTLTSLLIDDFVRSGQRVSFMDGDVTVVGSVGSGAEIVAGGSIHIYGALRGRAMAGASGNTRARIFCQALQAELLAIGSHFKTLDEIGDDLRQGPVQVWLDGVDLNIAAMRTTALATDR